MITDEQLAEEQAEIEKRIALLTANLHVAQGALALLKQLRGRSAEEVAA